MGIIDLTIEELGPKGDGVHCGEHSRTYIDRAIPGDKIKAKIHRDEMGVNRGEIVSILTPSPYRQAPPCVHYDYCGNCTLQHLQEGFYRDWKLEMVKEAFRKQGLRPRKWLPPVFIGGSNRRRATFSVYKNRSKLVIGYYRRRSQEITDIDSCLVADPKIMELRESLKPLLHALLREGKPVDVFLQLVPNAVDVVITGAIGRSGIADPEVKDVINQFIKNTPVTRLCWRQRELDNIEILFSRGRISVPFGELDITLPPAAFLQPTAEGEKALVDAVMEAVPPKGNFADLFSGCGTFSGPLLKRGPVDAFESVPSAVKALGGSTGKQHPLKVFRRDLVNNPLRREELNRYDVVVFDPPRAGCKEQAEAMASARTSVLIGVSCNPATFARDARILCEGGYGLQTLKVVDQFLWSHHVEMVGVFQRIRSNRPGFTKSVKSKNHNQRRR